jgi:hypothetical protein
MTLVTDQPPKTFMTWLGRQVAHIKHALHTDVTAPEQQVIYRTLDTQEHPHPHHPNVMLRRTTIDEVILNKEGRTLNDQG